MENPVKEKVLKPSNQKSVYHSFALVYEKLMNEEITIDVAEQASNALNGMNRAYALEIKLAELKKEISPRIIELTNFEEDQKKIG